MAPASTILKDALSFIGALCLAAPWILDYFVKIRRTRTQRLPTELDLKKKLVSQYDSWLSAPKLHDFLLTLGGILMLAAAYLVALLQSLGLVAS